MGPCGAWSYSIGVSYGFSLLFACLGSPTITSILGFFSFLTVHCLGNQRSPWVWVCWFFVLGFFVCLSSVSVYQPFFWYVNSIQNTLPFLEAVRNVNSPAFWLGRREATIRKGNQTAFCVLSLQITSESSVRESVAWGSGRSVLNCTSAEQFGDNALFLISITFFIYGGRLWRVLCKQNIICLNAKCFSLFSKHIPFSVPSLSYYIREENSTVHCCK